MCGVEFYPKRKDKIFCSSSCVHSYYYFNKQKIKRQEYQNRIKHCVFCEKEFIMPEKKKEFLFSLSKAKGDFTVEAFRSGGKGGQHQNKTSSGCRIRHPDSGAVAESREERSFFQNRKQAFLRLTKDPVFVSWYRVACAMAVQGVKDFEREMERRVEEQMRESNLKVEFFDPEDKV